MNKEFLVILLEKDIRELELLTEGFADLDVFPKPILQLARQKAENIIKNLNELESLNLKIKVTDSVNDDLAEVKEENSENDEVKFIVEETSEKSLLTDVRETEVEEPEIVEEEEIEDNEPVEFIEDIKEYGISNKNSEETHGYDETKLDIEEIFVESVDEPIVEVKSEEKIEAKEVQNAPNEPIVITNDVETDDSAVTTLNSSIKIEDIRTAINIGDRFRFQRELFGGNGEVMNKTIAYLNQLAKFEEATSFLNNKFGWTKENQHAEDFLQIIRRRYL